MSDTIFQKIIDREIPADIVFEDEEVLAFRDINPQAPVHILVIPKTPIPTLNDIQPDHTGLIGKLFQTAARLAEEEGIAESGYRTVVNTNGDGGQEVYHLHVHLLGGRSLTWPPG